MIDIDTKLCSAAKKRDEKLSLLKKQVKVRKKILGQNIHIIFTRARKRRPVNDLVKELSAFIDQSSSDCSSYVEDPSSMVGKHIQHRFEIDNTSEVKWYHGTVIDYDTTTKLHEIEYEGEEEHCYFDLKIDILNGDIKVIGH